MFAYFPHVSIRSAVEVNDWFRIYTLFQLAVHQRVGATRERWAPAVPMSPCDALALSPGQVDARRAE